MGLKQQEITKCLGCGKGVMHNNMMTFYRIQIETFVANLDAIQRQHGLEMMMGAAAPLAMHMGPDEDMAIEIGQPMKGLLCLECTYKHVASLIENQEQAGEAGDG